MSKLTKKAKERNARLLELLLALGLGVHPQTSTELQQAKARDVLVAIAGLGGDADVSFDQLASAACMFRPDQRGKV
jgi:hypothetical protein